MNRTLIATTALALAFTAYQANAANIPAQTPSTKKVDNTLRHLQEQADSVSEITFLMREQGPENSYRATQPDNLGRLAGQLNHMQTEIEAIDASRNTLSMWQREAVDEIQPEIRQLALNANAEVVTFNTHAPLFADAYKKQADELSHAARKIATQIHQQLTEEKLAAKYQALLKASEINITPGE